MATAIERALAGLDVAAAENAFREQDEFVFIQNYLSASALPPLLHDVDRLEPRLHRNYIPRQKKGGNVSHLHLDLFEQPASFSESGYELVDERRR